MRGGSGSIPSGAPGGAARKGRRLDAALALLLAGMLAGAASLTIAGDAVRSWSGEPARESCWWHAATGTDCPTCGLTRSFVALLDGHPVDAFRFHPAGPLVALAMFAALGWILAAAVRRRPPIIDRLAFRRTAMAVAVFCVLAGVARAAAGAA
ncbi:MAG: DUF2752 domain-containing protein [Deltaproteobacteria bacterium]|nr:DUF2752 domain-containing protein [Deltaproteobacteria bacterium]